jgi:hypothetical protein
MRRSCFGLKYLVFFASLLPCFFASPFEVIGFANMARADDVVATEPVLERPTLRCLGAYWVVPDGAGARVDVAYRRAGEAAWRAGAAMFRVERGKHKSEKYGSRLDVP